MIRGLNRQLAGIAGVTQVPESAHRVSRRDRPAVRISHRQQEFGRK